MAAVPSPAWGQWSGTNPVWTNSNVGIGVTNPPYSLDVNGTMHVTSGLYANSMWMQGGSAISVSSDTQNLYLSGNGNIFASVGGAIRLNINSSGNVGIGTTNPQYKLAVNGNIGAQDIIVTNTGWSDYVFRPGYRLRPLSEVSQFIQANGHLPEIPTEAEVK